MLKKYNFEENIIIIQSQYISVSNGYRNQRIIYYVDENDIHVNHIMIENKITSHWNDKLFP